MKKNMFLWLDLEMTGLNPEHDVILEIAALLTDPQLTTIIDGPDLVIYQPETELLKMNSWVRQHHQASGLTEKVMTSTISLEQAEQHILDFLATHAQGYQLYFAGNSIHVDRSFIQKYMPKLDACAHYRLLDVSALKLLVKDWYGFEFKKSKTHRALDDIRESLQELQYYRDNFFVKEQKS